MVVGKTIQPWCVASCAICTPTTKATHQGIFTDIKMKAMEATPTEYKGVEYRSKCEAMFAMHLELELEEGASIRQWIARDRGKRITHGSGGFEYEPETLVDNWNPDFLVWEAWPAHGSADRFFHHVPTLEMRFIEYKPCMPTVSYKEKFKKGFLRWQSIASKESPEHFYRTSASIYYGSPYTKNRSAGVGKIDIMCGGHCDDREDWGVNTFEQILAYRFDLQAMVK